MEKKKKQKKSNPIAAFLWKNKRRRAKNFYFTLTAFMIFFAVGMAFINEKLDLIDTGDVADIQTTQQIYD